MIMLYENFNSIKQNLIIFIFNWILIQLKYMVDREKIKNNEKNIGGYDYGIIVSQKSNLELVSDKIVRMPLKFWLVI